VQELLPEVELVEVDVGNVESVRAACHGCEYVVHASALMGAWMLDRSQYIKVSSLSPSCTSDSHVISSSLLQ
jgi:nucleoside-diphosphate-sugar epimerase